MVLETLTKPGINIKDITISTPENHNKLSFDPEQETPKKLFDEFENLAIQHDTIDAAGINGWIPLADLKILSELRYRKVTSNPIAKDVIATKISEKINKYKREIVNDFSSSPLGPLRSMLSYYADSKELSLKINDFGGFHNDLVTQLRNSTILIDSFLPQRVDDIVNVARAIPDDNYRSKFNSFLKDSTVNKKLEIQTKLYEDLKMDSSFGDFRDIVIFTQLAADLKLLSGNYNTKFELNKDIFDKIKNDFITLSRSVNVIFYKLHLFRAFRNLKIITSDNAFINSDGLIIIEDTPSLERPISEVPAIRSF